MKIALTYLNFTLRTSPTENFPITPHPFNGCAICKVDNFQRLIFGNSQPPEKLTRNPKMKNQHLHCAPSTGSIAQPGFHPDSKTTLLGQLFLPRDMSDPYKAFLYDDKQPPETLQ